MRYTSLSWLRFNFNYAYIWQVLKEINDLPPQRQANRKKPDQCCY